jgi:cytochrome c-type biogenesis protein CcmH/NrfF
VSTALCVLLLAGVASAQGSGGSPSDEAFERHRRAHQLSMQLMSPYCPGRTLANCPSPNADVVREEIRRYMDLGLSDAEIAARVKRDFGVGAPVPGSPIGWTIPIAALVLGAVGLAALIVRLRASEREPTERTVVPRGVANEVEAELDAALAEHDLHARPGSASPARGS